MFLGLSLFGVTEARGSGMQPKLPVIGQVGVIPVQWSGGSDPIPPETKEAIDTSFPQAVRASRRFRVLSDDLVEGLWQDAKGRDELRNEFELHGFVSLTVVPRSDLYVLTARVLDTDLNSKIAETDVIPRDLAVDASTKQLSDRLEALVFRLINRIPVDVSVTSVQGPFLTLSGGSEQGLALGDQVNLVRSTIKSLHPADGTWLEFDRKSLGQAVVVELKRHASVAKLTSLVKENAVEVGDGAKVPAIAGRARFQRLEKKDAFQDAGAADTIVVPPLYTDLSPAQGAVGALSPKRTVPKGTPPRPEGQPIVESTDAALANVSPSAPAAAEEAPEDSGEAPDETPASHADRNEPSLWDTVSSEVTGKKPLDDLQVYAGPYWWKVDGKSFDEAGKFPLWLVNSVGVGVTRTLLFKVKTGFGGGLLFGKTTKGSFIGYDTHARMYWEDSLALLDGFLKWWKAGGQASFSGISVSAGKYGGGDWIRAGAFGGLGGTFTVGDDADRYDWFGEFSLMPLNVGRLGYDGGQKGVESALGTRFALGAIRFEPPRIIQWGGSIEYASERQTLKNGQRAALSETSLKVIGRYAF